MTLKYLEACHKLFENGFLSHNRIFTMDSDVLKSVDQGYNFFTTWFVELMDKGIVFLFCTIYSWYYTHIDPQFQTSCTASDQRLFLSWQSKI